METNYALYTKKKHSKKQKTVSIEKVAPTFPASLTKCILPAVTIAIKKSLLFDIFGQPGTLSEESYSYDYSTYTQKDDNNHAFNYDDEIKVTLGGGEVRIWKFSPVQDVTPAKALTIEANTATCDTVVVTFDEPVDVTKAKFSVTQKGKQVCQADSVTLLADLRSVSVKLPKALKAGKAYELSVESLSDWNGNTNSVTVPFGVYKGAEILTAKAAKAGKQQVKKCKNAVADVNDFSVVVKLEPGVGANGSLLKADGVSVSLKDGHVVDPGFQQGIAVGLYPGDDVVVCVGEDVRPLPGKGRGQPEGGQSGIPGKEPVVHDLPAAAVRDARPVKRKDIAPVVGQAELLGQGKHAFCGASACQDHLFPHFLYVDQRLLSLRRDLLF